MCTCSLSLATCPLYLSLPLLIPSAQHSPSPPPALLPPPVCRIKEAQRQAKLRRTTSQREADYLEAEKAALKQQAAPAVPSGVPPPAALVTVV